MSNNILFIYLPCYVQQSAKMEKMEGTVFAPALEGIKLVKSEQGEILSQPFLDVCKHILPVIGTCWSLPLLVLLDIWTFLVF
jgi:hypothetical protein